MSPSSSPSNLVFLASTSGAARAMAFEFLQKNVVFDVLNPPLILADVSTARVWRALFREKSHFLPFIVSPEEYFARAQSTSARSRAISGRDRLWLLMGAARRVSPLLRHLGAAALSRDWVMGISSLFCQMRRAQKSEFPPHPWSDDLRRIWNAYNERLEALNAFDLEDAPALFGLSAPHNTTFRWPSVVLVDDRTDWSPALQTGVNALLDRAQTGIATLCAPGGQRENPVVAEALAFWKTRRARVLSKRQTPTPQDRAAARVLGAENGQCAPDSLKITRAHTPFEEFSRIASDIRERLQKGAHPHSFTLVVPGAARFLDEMEAAFEAHGVPLSLPFSRALSESPLVRRLLQLFGACGHEWDADVLHDLFGDGTLVLPGFDPWRLRRGALAARFSSLEDPEHARSVWEKTLAQLRQTRRDDRARREAIEATLEAGDLDYVARIQALCRGCAGQQKTPQKIGGAAWLCAIEELLALFCAHWESSEDALSQKARAQLAGLREGAQAVVERARDLSIEGEESAISPLEWLQWLRLECETRRFESAAAGAGIRVLGASSSLSEGETVYFAGLCEGEFPASELCGPFAARGAQIFADIRMGTSALARATHTLARALAESRDLSLSSSMLEAGREIAPSPLLDDLRALWVKHEFPALPTPQPTSRARFLRAASPLHPDLPRALHTLHVLQKERATPNRLGVYDGVLGARGAALMDLWREKNGALRWSASALESYARCPLRFFFERILGFQAPENDDDDLDAARSGSLLHEILFDFHSRHRAPLSGENWDQSLRILRECAWAACQNLALRPILREAEFHRLMGLGGESGPLPKTLRAEIAATCEQGPRPWNQVTRPVLHSPWRPLVPLLTTGLEQKFEMKIGSISLGGTLDRLDISEDGALAVILDYKSGGTQNLPSLASGDDGLHFQLALYALKAREYFAAWPAVPRLAVGFLSLRNGEFSRAIGQSGTLGRSDARKFTQKKAVELDDDAWENWLESVEKRVQSVAALLGNATFNISLHDEKTARCPHCHWRASCGQNPKTQAERAPFWRGRVEVYLPEVWTK